MRTQAFFKPVSEGRGEKIALQKPISAIQVFQNEDGTTRLGLLSKLGAGVVLERCGEGFNTRTVAVRADGHSYFVFVDDLECQSGAKAHALSA